jgi:cellulose synthase/poly-beta-1,6-N-acetylglucosamine synthase-like glycosyltransferase
MITGFLVLLLTVYGLILMWLFWGLKKAKTPQSPAAINDPVPDVSVILAAHNEEKNLPRCLSALAKQDYPKHRMQVIVVNDRSTDRTGVIAEEWAHRDPRFHAIHIRKTRGDRPPKKYAIERGIHQASGEILLFTDADCMPPAGWVRGMASLFSPGTAMVVGITFLRSDNTFWSRLRSLDSLWNGLIAVASAVQDFPLTCGGGNLAYRKSAFEAAGGFRQFYHSLSGDDDLLMHTFHKKRLGKIVPAIGSHALVVSNAPRTWRQLFRQKRRHLSASKYYPVEKKIFLAIFQGGILLLTALPILLTASGHLYWPVALFVLSAKLAIDHRFLQSGSRIFDLRVSWIDFLFYELVYPFAVVVFAISGWFGKVTWK